MLNASTIVAMHRVEIGGHLTVMEAHRRHDEVTWTLRCDRCKAEYRKGVDAFNENVDQFCASFLATAGARCASRVTEEGVGFEGLVS